MQYIQYFEARYVSKDKDHAMLLDHPCDLLLTPL